MFKGLMVMMLVVGAVFWSFVAIAKFGSCNDGDIVWSTKQGFNDCAFRGNDGGWDSYR